MDETAFSRLSEQEKTIISSNLTEKEQEEVKRIVDEMWAIYLFVEKGGIHKPWMDDSERFMGFTFIHTRNLVKHSITLSKLTGWLIGITIALGILATVQIVLLISFHFNWF